MAPSYLDYEHLQYYHQKLKLEFNSMVMSDSDIDAAFYSNKKLTISSDEFLRIKIGNEINPSGRVQNIPIEWELKNFTLQGFTDYAYKNAFSLCQEEALFGEYRGITYSIDTREADGIAIELVCKDESNKTHYYSTIGNGIPNFNESEYPTWSGLEYYTAYGRLDSNIWNFIQFDIPVGTSKTYHLNYYTDSYDAEEEGPSDRLAGILNPVDDFQITIFHNVYEYYSVMFYWDPSKSLHVA